ncbi:MAG TPA: carbohydrate ABC transporter permease, partial [Limnochordia bacterium]|nr:carbohydrate ABC transporter permease [Limnochordia bacterium]
PPLSVASTKSRVKTSAVRPLAMAKPIFWGRLFGYSILALGAAAMIMPFVWTVAASFKTYSDLFYNPYRLIPTEWTWSNYVEVFRQVPFHLYIFNTVKITLLSTVGVLITSSLAAYAFARLQFPGRDIVFMAYLATMMIPRQITLVPTFVLMKWLNLLDTHASLILPGMFSAYGTFLLRQFFLTVPRELEEAATIDGCGYIRRFTTIILPLSKPALATLGIFIMMQVWNDFLYPMVFIQTDELRTIALGLSIFRGDLDIQWNLIMAATTISIIPMTIAFLSAQRFFVEGIALTGIKG